jgi:hypothetical protein
MSKFLLLPQPYFQPCTLCQEQHSAYQSTQLGAGTFTYFLLVVWAIFFLNVTSFCHTDILPATI